MKKQRSPEEEEERIRVYGTTTSGCGCKGYAYRGKCRHIELVRKRELEKDALAALNAEARSAMQAESMAGHADHCLSRVTGQLCSGECNEEVTSDPLEGLETADKWPPPGRSEW